MAWIFGNALFIISFPVLSSAMTSYTPNVAAYIQDYNGNYIKAQDFLMVEYVVQDGSRAGLNGNYTATALNYGPHFGKPTIRTI
jgi:hypothetical protein